MTITIVFQNGSSIVCLNCTTPVITDGWMTFTGDGEDGKRAEFHINMANVSFYKIIYP